MKPKPLPIGPQEKTRVTRGVTYTCVSKTRVGRKAFAYLYSLNPHHVPVRCK